MNFIQKLLYFICAVFIFVVLGMLEYFILPYVTQLFTLDWTVNLVSYILVLILINPFITKLILDKVPFKIK